MARKISLREFQEGVTARLQGLAGVGPSSSKLGLDIASQLWLVDLTDVSEVAPIPPLASVPMTRSWFKGVANIRGNLFTVVDFSALTGGAPAAVTSESRLLLVHPRFKVNAGLLVDRMLGLRNPEQLQRKEAGPGDASWISAGYTDAANQTWKELNMGELVGGPEFLRVGL
jgi:twitching motility protein PilI